MRGNTTQSERPIYMVIATRVFPSRFLNARIEEPGIRATLRSYIGLKAVDVRTGAR